MTTTSSNHRQIPFIAAAATALGGALLAVTLSGAQAAPGAGSPTAPGGAPGQYVEHGCFTTPLTWNHAVDGPLPRCFTYTP